MIHIIGSTLKERHKSTASPFFTTILPQNGGSKGHNTAQPSVHREARFLPDPVERLIGLLFGTNLTCKRQPTVCAYFFSVVIDGECLIEDSSLDMALFVVPISSATAS
jgi:hypothetical protein